MIPKPFIVSGLMFWALSAMGSNTEHPEKTTHIEVFTETGSNHKIHIQALNAEPSKVLAELGRVTGTRFHFTNLPEKLLNLHCSSSSAKEAIECLFGAQVNLISSTSNIASDKAGKSFQQNIWILNSNVSAAAPCSSCDESLASKNIIVAQANDEKPANAVVKPEQMRQLQKKLNVIAKLSDSHQNLHAALADKDPAIRAQAIFAASRLEDNDLESILTNALQDDAVSVRLMAVESSEDRPHILNMALNDDDNGVRELAALKLKSIATPNDHLP